MRRLKIWVAIALALSVCCQGSDSESDGVSTTMAMMASSTAEGETLVTDGTESGGWMSDSEFSLDTSTMPTETSETTESTDNNSMMDSDTGGTTGGLLPQPEDGTQYADCGEGLPCQPGLLSIPKNGQACMCTYLCEEDENCPTLSGAQNPAICLLAVSDMVCALSCDGYLCPEGMDCLLGFKEGVEKKVCMTAPSP